MKGINIIFLATLVSVEWSVLKFPLLFFFKHQVTRSYKDAKEFSNLDLEKAGSCKDAKDASLLDDIIAEVEYLNFWIDIKPN